MLLVGTATSLQGWPSKQVLLMGVFDLMTASNGPNNTAWG